jgi:uncharacterized OB-fold protein
MTYAKPLPEPSAVTRPFWDGLREGRLRLQRSRTTGQWVFYPRAVSPFGAGDELDWQDASGRGTVYSFTIARRPTAPQWEGETPYVIAIVELAEGPRLITNIVGCDPESVRIGMPVTAEFTPVTDEITLLHFRPAPPA